MSLEREGIPAVRRVGKSAAAFRTISEVSGELDVPPHVLRFWETKFAQLRPLKRGGGRRYYRPEDIDLLRRIRELLYEQGYTIKGVQRLLRENGRPGDGAEDDEIEEKLPQLALAGVSPVELSREDLEEILHQMKQLRAFLDTV